MNKQLRRLLDALTDEDASKLASQEEDPFPPLMWPVLPSPRAAGVAVGGAGAGAGAGPSALPGGAARGAVPTRGTVGHIGAYVQDLIRQAGEHKHYMDSLEIRHGTAEAAFAEAVAASALAAAEAALAVPDAVAGPTSARSSGTGSSLDSKWGIHDERRLEGFDAAVIRGCNDGFPDGDGDEDGLLAKMDEAASDLRCLASYIGVAFALVRQRVGDTAVAALAADDPRAGAGAGAGPSTAGSGSAGSRGMKFIGASILVCDTELAKIPGPPLTAGTVKARLRGALQEAMDKVPVAEARYVDALARKAAFECSTAGASDPVGLVAVEGNAYNARQAATEAAARVVQLSRLVRVAHLKTLALDPLGRLPGLRALLVGGGPSMGRACIQASLPAATALGKAGGEGFGFFGLREDVLSIIAVRDMALQAGVVLPAGWGSRSMTESQFRKITGARNTILDLLRPATLAAVLDSETGGSRTRPDADQLARATALEVALQGVIGFVALYPGGSAGAFTRIKTATARK